FGFLKGRSCEDAVQTLVDTIVTQIDKKFKCLTIFLDLSKAFDCVNHEILLSKLESFGFRDDFLKFLESYLSDRNQRVRLNDTLSSYQKIYTGVPQGSVLGPLFFVLYTNDLFSLCNEYTTILSFADDTSVTISAENLKDLYYKANIMFNRIYKWLCRNQLALNINKSKYIKYSWYLDSLETHKAYTIRMHDKFCSVDLNLNNCNCCSIECVDNVKYLGVLIDSALSWRSHIGKLCKKLRYVLLCISKLKHVTSIKFLRIIYFSLFQSHIQYCLPVYGSAFPSIMNSLFLVQKKCIRQIGFNNTINSTNALFKEFDI